jgi:hypothetical protein
LARNTLRNIVRYLLSLHGWNPRDALLEIKQYLREFDAPNPNSRDTVNVVWCAFHLH